MLDLWPHFVVTILPVGLLQRTLIWSVLQARDRRNLLEVFIATISLQFFLFFLLLYNNSNTFAQQKGIHITKE